MAAISSLALIVGVLVQEEEETLQNSNWWLVEMP